MKKFEYIKVQTKTPGDYDTNEGRIDFLNSQGQQGWQMVSFIPSPFGDHFIFMREI